MFSVGAIVFIAVCVSGGLAYRWHAGQKKTAQDEIERLRGAQATKMKILGTLMKIRNKSQYKMKLMEDLMIEIEMMKICVGQLKDEKLITESAHAITLTDFGKKYAQVYVDHEEENG